MPEVGLIFFVSVLVSFIIGILSDKKLFSKGLSVFGEVVDVINSINLALEDEKISEKELRDILKESKEVLEAVREEEEPA